MSELNFMHENISGIYNYCDRWCEKCAYTNRCLLFKQQAEREIEYILKDENTNEEDYFSKFSEEEMEEIEQLFADDLEEDVFSFEEEFDFDDEEDEELDELEFDELYDEEDLDDEKDDSEIHPLVKLAEVMFVEFDNYTRLIKEYFPLEVEKYDTSVPLIKNLQVLSWYSPQILVKIRMCYWEKKQIDKSNSKAYQEIEEEMLNVNARLAYLGIEKCITALSEISSQQKQIERETKLLISTFKIVRKMFLEEFPSGQTYKRPYFD